MKYTIFVLAALLVSASVMAQQPMYRCGNNFQDRPCDGGAPASKTGSASPSTQANAAGPPAKSAAVPAAASAATKSAPGSVADAQKAALPLTKAQQQRQIRCENFSRQRDELRDRQKASPQQAAAVGVQIKSLETRMSSDSCS